MFLSQPQKQSFVAIEEDLINPSIIVYRYVVDPTTINDVLEEDFVQQSVGHHEILNPNDSIYITQDGVQKKA